MVAAFEQVCLSMLHKNIELVFSLLFVKLCLHSKQSTVTSECLAGPKSCLKVKKQVKWHSCPHESWFSCGRSELCHCCPAGLLAWMFPCRSVDGIVLMGGTVISSCWRFSWGGDYRYIFCQRAFVFKKTHVNVGVGDHVSSTDFEKSVCQQVENVLVFLNCLLLNK